MVKTYIKYQQNLNECSSMGIEKEETEEEIEQMEGMKQYHNIVQTIDGGLRGGWLAELPRRKWKGSLENMMFLHRKSSQEKEDKKRSSNV